MQFSNPAFIIPNKNNKIDKKSGGGSYPDYFGKLEDFEELKMKRIQETENIIDKISLPANILLDDATDNIYFEISFHEDVKSKSSLPMDFLTANHISLFGQKFNDSFLATCSSNDFLALNNQIKKIELKSTKSKYSYSEDSAYLSTISGLNLSSKADILHMDDNWEELERVNSYIYLSNALSKTESNRIVGKILEFDIESNAELLKLTSGGPIVYGNFSSKFLDQISSPDPRNPIQKIEQGLIFRVSKQQNIPFESKDILFNDLSLDSKVAVFDSGIYEHDFIKPFILGKLNYTAEENHIDAIGHGTFVASRIIYGDDIKDQIYSRKMQARSKLLDVKIFDNSGSVSDRILLEALNDVVIKYPEIKIFNLSLNSDKNTEILKGSKNIITREIDTLAYKYKIIIIVSAGNHNTFQTCKYPDCLLDNNAIFTPPADTINGLSVGSIVKKVSTDSVVKNIKEVSPFSRCGINNLYKKPDLVHFGGNIDKYNSFDGIGETGLSHEDSNKISENIGTSFSAPLVSGIAGNIYAYLEKTKMVENLSDMTKALLLHSAQYSLPLGSILKQEDLNKMVGFGVPDFNLAFDNSLHSAMFLYTGELKAYEDKGIDNENKHKIQFTIPEELKQTGKELRIRGTLVYTPAITGSGDKNYALSDLELNLHYLNSKGNLTGGKLTTDADEDYRIDWNPIKHFEKRIRSTQFNHGLWEVWLTLNLRGELYGYDYTQPYALIISIEDISSDYSQRVEIGNIIKLKHPEYQTLEIRERIKI